LGQRCGLGHKVPEGRFLCPNCGLAAVPPTTMRHDDDAMLPGSGALDGGVPTDLNLLVAQVAPPATTPMRPRIGRRGAVVAFAVLVLAVSGGAFALSRGGESAGTPASGKPGTGANGDADVEACAAKTLYLAHLFQASRTGTITREQADELRRQAELMPHPGVSDNSIYPWATTLSTMEDTAQQPVLARSYCSNALHPYTPSPSEVTYPTTFQPASGSCNKVMAHLYDSLYHGDFGTGESALAAAQATLGDEEGRKTALADAWGQELNIPDGIAFLDDYCDRSE